MTKTREGPHLPALLQRIAETPPDFLAEPKIGNQGVIVVAAVVRDLLELYALSGGPRLRFDPTVFTPRTPADRGWATLTLVQCWLLSDPVLLSPRLRPATDVIRNLLQTAPRELAEHTTATQLVGDQDRREELARLTLSRMGLRPAGESEAHAQDRLTTLSSVERARVIAASRAAEQRAREVREALARKAAEESADKWSRE